MANFKPRTKKPMPWKKLLVENVLWRYRHPYLTLFSWWKIKLTNRFREAMAGYLFISIWLVGFIALTAIPLFESFLFSFNIVRFTQGIETEWIGFANYISIFTSDLTFFSALQTFVFELVLNVPVIIILAMIIALLLNRTFKFRAFFRAVFFLPVIITSGPIVSELLRQGAGTIPSLTESGFLTIISDLLPPVLANPLINLFTQIIFILWFSGVQVVLFLAGLQKMDQSMYEAAQMDGANGWETFWKITLPSLKNIILVSAVYTIVTLATFSNNVLVVYIRSTMYESITGKGGGYASALAWIYFTVVSLLLVIASLLIHPPEKKVMALKTYNPVKSR